jgi:uncharacterized membrane protein
MQTAHRSGGRIFIAISLGVLLIAGLIAVKVITGGNGSVSYASGDLEIIKDEVTETVKFYPYKADGTKMEILAVRAGDGTVRTAFNTCQVCYDSGRGYYEQEGDELVCQNCGNRFKLNQIGVLKGGCNPVPLPEEHVTDDGVSITVSQSLMEEARFLFKNWEK